MKILFTFPGQGTQHEGMLQNLPGTELEQARAVLGAEVDTLDSASSLTHTRAVQLSLLIAGVAWARELERRGVSPDIVSGLSIGAYPAAVIAGSLDFTDALKLVALRGDLMEQAYPHGYGLTAIMGLTLPQVENLIQGTGTYIANLNAETQIVIAGTDDGMAQVAERALAKGASKAKRLAVSVPSHCALLAEPAKKLAAAFESVTLSRPRCAYLSGSTGRVLWQPEKIADDLAMNMARTVRWQEAVISANEREARLAIEMPPGGILTCLTRQAAWEGESISLERSGVDVAVHLAGRLRACVFLPGGGCALPGLRVRLYYFVGRVRRNASPPGKASGSVLQTSGVHPPFRGQCSQARILLAVAGKDDRNQLLHLVRLCQLQ